MTWDTTQSDMEHRSPWIGKGDQHINNDQVKLPEKNKVVQGSFIISNDKKVQYFYITTIITYLIKINFGLAHWNIKK